MANAIAEGAARAPHHARTIKEVSRLLLVASTTGYQSANTGLSGYQDFMSWVKSQTIAGHQVTLGVLLNSQAGGSDAQYDHIVSVIKIGTNHAPTDPTYYADDVLYFDDHGVCRYCRTWKTIDRCTATSPRAPICSPTRPQMKLSSKSEASRGVPSLGSRSYMPRPRKLHASPICLAARSTQRSCSRSLPA